MCIPFRCCLFNAILYTRILIYLTFCACDCVVVGIEIDAELDSDGKLCDRIDISMTLSLDLSLSHFNENFYYFIHKLKHIQLSSKKV